MILHDLVDNKCSTCGGNSLTLAEDYTDYSPCECGSNGKWFRVYVHSQTDKSENAVRFFCADCGTPHKVPKELK